jgi:hypothetical protein
MKPKFRKTIEKIKAAAIKAGAKEPIPRVRFSADIRGKLVDYSDRLDYFEGMTILLETHPFFPFGNKFSLGDILDYRRALAYEIIIRFLGHCRSLIANSNTFNHIGTAVALRCMLELYAFLIYLKHNNYKDDAKFLEKLLHGSFLSSGSGEWYEYEQVWKQKPDEPLPDNFKEFVKTLLKTPRVGKYLKSVNDQGFDYMYAIYSNFVHPTFGRPRSQFLEDIGQESVGIALEDSNYYLLAQKQPSPPNSLKRDISAAGFCLELSWPEIMALDPFFDKELGIFKATD